MSHATAFATPEPATNAHALDATVGPVNTGRLLKLARMLDVADKAEYDKAGYSVLRCGTVVYAVGLATEDGIFRGLGLHTVPDQGIREPAYRGQVGWEALMLFFGLTYEHAEFLFDAAKYIDKPRAARDVAARIRLLLERLLLR